MSSINKDQPNSDPCSIPAKSSRFSLETAVKEMATTTTVESQGRTKLRRKVNFQNAWLQLPEFSKWLVKVPGDAYTSECTICSVVFSNYGKSQLQKHGKGKKHLELMAQHERESSLMQQQQNDSVSVAEDEDVEVMLLETRLICFIVENNLPISFIDKLVPFIKSLPPKHILDMVRVENVRAAYLAYQGPNRTKAEDGSEMAFMQL